MGQVTAEDLKRVEDKLDALTARIDVWEAKVRFWLLSGSGRKIAKMFGVTL